MAYTAIQIEGGLFPADLLDAIATGDAPGQRDEDFHLKAGTRLTDEIQLAFSEIRKHRDSFQARLGRSTESPTTLTREHWIIPLFETLGVALEFQRAGLQVGADSFIISHVAGSEDDASPVHVVALDQSLDRRGDGSRRSPHATVQEYLNRSDAVWGIVTNGDHLRVLRDAQALARPTYIQFDLRAMVEGNLYSEFVVLFRLLHHTRWVTPRADALSWLETYYQEGIDIGGRVREHLRDGVEEAIKRLGSVFLAHPESHALRAAISAGELDATDYYRELLRLIYRFLFLMVVEERKLLFTDDGNAQDALERQSIYTRYYSMARLRDRCERRIEDDGFDDLWEGLKQSFLLFREQDRAHALGLSALNGELFGPAACAHIEDAHCGNADLLIAVFHLSTFFDQKTRRRVNYAALDVEELGSVYESLLDFHPVVNLDYQPPFDLVTGSERKQTGSYYTPPSLVAELIKSALVPVMMDRLDHAATWDAKEAALLDLRVVDPASGSGHFLLAAARRIARELARVRLQEDEPSPPQYRQALRDVVRNCIYAVDKNPLAVDLCKVALWIEGYNAGLPLSFLDNHIKHGDSLVGVMDLQCLSEGIPDGAYAPVTGDDKAVATSLKKQNKAEREGQIGFWSGIEPPDIGELAAHFRALGLAEEKTPYDVHAKERAYEGLRSAGSTWWRDKVACDLWTAAFFVPLTQREFVPTTDTVRQYLRNPGTGDGRIVGEVVALSLKENFFHWPLEFPDVIDRGGFDVVLGNPPWERIKLQELEFFAARHPVVARTPTAVARKAAIAALKSENTALHIEFESALHTAEAQSRFIRASGRFPLCGRGDVNTYSVFAETNHSLVAQRGRVGVIIPTGIATDDTNKEFFGGLVRDRSLISLYDFENRKNIFPGVGHGRFKFSLITVSTTGMGLAGADLACFLLDPDELGRDDKHFSLSADDFQLINPNTLTLPIFRSKRDAELTKAIYRRVPVLIREGDPDGNPWGMNFTTMFHMSNDSGLFRTRSELEAEGWQLQGKVFMRRDERYLPLYEAKFIWHYDHRLGSYGNFTTRPENTHLPPTTAAEHGDPQFVAVPWYWVPEREVSARLHTRWKKQWFLGWRDICRSTDERTVIATVFPQAGVGNKLPLMILESDKIHLTACLAANLSAFCFDYASRQKIGGTSLNFFIYKQLPVLPPEEYEGRAPWSPSLDLHAWMSDRVVQLTYTAWDMQPFARDLGHDGPPFPWDEEHRFSLRCELDAAFFHLYGIERDDVEYIMDTFPIVKRKDEAKWGEYRTKRVILELYDAMQRATETGVPYRADVLSSLSTADAAPAAAGL